MHKPEQDFALRKAAENVLSRTLGRPITFARMDLLTEPDRHIAVYRCSLAGEPGGIIIKKHSPAGLTSEGPSPRESIGFYNDWAGSEFLSSLPSNDPISPRFYGGDVGQRFFLLEDLGEHRSMVQPLLEGDAASAEAALLRYAACLGKLHARTAGKAEEYLALFTSRFPGSAPFAFELHELEPRIKRVLGYLEDIGVSTPSYLQEEIQAVIHTVRDPGPFLVYIHSDPCPDNDFDLENGMRLIDFETGHFGHALVDAVYPRMVWPSCWCANRVPAGALARFETSYRLELSRGVPEAQEDAAWETALAHLSGMAMLNTLGRHLEIALQEDREWGRATLRQRVLTRLDTFLHTAEEFHRLPALRAAASQVLPILRSRWPDTPELDVYPAFLG